MTTTMSAGLEPARAANTASRRLRGHGTRGKTRRTLMVVLYVVSGTALARLALAAVMFPPGHVSLARGTTHPHMPAIKSLRPTRRWA